MSKMRYLHTRTEIEKIVSEFIQDTSGIISINKVPNKTVEQTLSFIYHTVEIENIDKSIEFIETHDKNQILKIGEHYKGVDENNKTWTIGDGWCFSIDQFELAYNFFHDNSVEVKKFKELSKETIDDIYEKYIFDLDCCKLIGEIIDGLFVDYMCKPSNPLIEKVDAFSKIYRSYGSIKIIKHISQMNNDYITEVIKLCYAYKNQTTSRRITQTGKLVTDSDLPNISKMIIDMCKLMILQIKHHKWENEFKYLYVDLKSLKNNVYELYKNKIINNKQQEKMLSNIEKWADEHKLVPNGLYLTDYQIALNNNKKVKNYTVISLKDIEI